MKTKTYVLTLSRTFPKGHPREGEETEFAGKALAANDGLSLEDWEAWFRDYDRTRPMAIIHFTNFRYCK